MKDTENLKKKILEYSAKINELIDSRAKMAEVNYWRRELNMAHKIIRERELGQKKTSGAE